MADYAGKIINDSVLSVEGDSAVGKLIDTYDHDSPPGPSTLYAQRLWDSGSGGRFVYYTKAVKDPAPSSGETTPNYTGSISGHTILAIRTV